MNNNKAPQGVTLFPESRRIITRPGRFVPYPQGMGLEAAKMAIRRNSQYLGTQPYLTRPSLG